MKCALRKQNNDSFGEFNPETSSEFDRAAEFRGHGQVEFPPCLETSLKNQYV